MDNVNYYSPEEIERALFNTSQEPNTSFIRFILLWASFNSRIAQGSQELNDAEMIKWVKRDDSVYRIRFQGLLDNNQRFQELIYRLCNIRVIDFIELKRREKAIRENRQRQQKPEFKQVRYGDFSSLIDVIYLVRCNLVHGSKNIEIPLEANLVELCYQTLLELYRPDVS